MLDILLACALAVSVCGNAYLLARLRAERAERRALEALMSRRPGFHWSTTTRRGPRDG